MRRIIVLASAITLTGVGTYLGELRVEGKMAEQTASDRQTSSVVSATNAFLQTLSAEQRQNVRFDFTPQKTAVIAAFHRTPDGGVAPGAPAGGTQGGPGGKGQPGAREQPSGQGQQEGPVKPSGSGKPEQPEANGGRGGPGQGGPGGPGFGMGPPGGFIGERYGQAVWSNFPVSDVLRPGLRLGSLTTQQRNAAMHVLQTVLSPMGYQKVLDIMGSDQALTGAGTNFASGEAVYTIAVFGEPSTSKPWMLEFGGHHLGLNMVIVGSKGVMTPTLTGAQPSMYQRGDKTVRVLAQENDTAFALLDALSEKQRKQAVLNYEIGDLVLGPGQAGKQIQPEGLNGSEMDEKQRAMLLNVIAQWAGIANEAYASARMAEIKADLNRTYFAWSGPTTHEPGKNGSAYYRIQGPKVIIEFSPQGVGGDATMHVHTIYRDPTDDYGVKLTGAA